MRGLKLLSVSALQLATNTAVENRPFGLKTTVEKPMAIEEPLFGRRKALQAILGATAAAAAPAIASALDMDAFMNKEIESDTKNCDPKKDRRCIPKLNADEALCKYGQSGDARGEACARVKNGGGALPGATKQKSLGGAYAM
jgi:hypothetical protein